MQTFTENDGLPSLTVYDLQPDSQGYIWAGTESGLQRFNGKRFTGMKGYEGSVSYIGISPQQEVWCYAFEGRLFRLRNDSLEEPFTALGFIRQYGFANGKLYIDAKDGLFIYDPASLKKIAQAVGLPKAWINVGFLTSGDTLVYAIKRDTNLQRIVLVHDRIIDTLYHGDAQRFATLLRQPERNGVPFTFERSTPGGLYRYVSCITDPVHIDAGWLENERSVRTTLSAEDAATFWLNTYNGAYLVNSCTSAAQLHILPGYAVSDVVRDFQGNHWVSTLQHGVIRIPSFSLLRHDTANVWPDERCFVLATGPNSLFVGHANGSVSQVDANGNVIDVQQAVVQKEVEALRYDSKNNVLFAVFRGVWWRTVAPGMEWKNSSAGVGSKHLAMRGDSVLYQLNGLSSIGCIRRVNDQYIEERYPDQDVMLDDIVYDEQRNEVWAISAKSGLFRLDQKGKTVLYDSTIKEKRLLMAGGQIWVLNPGVDLRVYDPDKRVAQAVAPAMLAGAKPRIITTCDGTTVYALCGSMIAELDSRDLNRCRMLNAGIDFPGMQIRDIKCFAGKIWFATYKGLYSIPVTALKEFVPPRFYVRSRELFGQRPVQPDEHEFPYTANNLLLRFDLVDYSPHLYNVCYRLHPGEPWRQVEKGARTLQLPALTPDQYQLEIALTGPDQQQRIVYSYTFEILPPFWKRMWFVLLVLLVLVALLSLFYVRRLRYNNRQHALKLVRAQEQEQIRSWQMSALRAQLNPHFMYNILNSIQGSISLSNKEMANEIITRFADLSRKVLDLSLEESSDLETELEIISLYLDLEKIRFEGRLDFRIEIDPGISCEQLRLPGLLLQPLVENAVVHGLRHLPGKKQLVIRVQRAGNAVLVEIEDEGIGMEAAAKINARRQRHRSFGIEAVKKRIELFNANAVSITAFEIIDKTTTGAGSGVIVRLLIAQ